LKILLKDYDLATLKVLDWGDVSVYDEKCIKHLFTILNKTENLRKLTIKFPGALLDL